MTIEHIADIMNSAGYEVPVSEVGRRKTFVKDGITATFWAIGYRQKEIRCFVVVNNKFVISTIGNTAYEFYDVPLERVLELLVRGNTLMKFENMLNEMRLDRLS